MGLGFGVGSSYICIMHNNYYSCVRSLQLSPFLLYAGSRGIVPGTDGARLEPSPDGHRRSTSASDSATRTHIATLSEQSIISIKPVSTNTNPELSFNEHKTQHSQPPTQAQHPYHDLPNSSDHHHRELHPQTHPHSDEPATRVQRRGHYPRHSPSQSRFAHARRLSTVVDM